MNTFAVQFYAINLDSSNAIKTIYVMDITNDEDILGNHFTWWYLYHIDTFRAIGDLSYQERKWLLGTNESLLCTFIVRGESDKMHGMMRDLILQQEELAGYNKTLVKML